MDAAPVGDRGFVLHIDRLRNGVEAALDLAIERFGTSVDLDRHPACKDHYWRLTAADAFSLREDIAHHIVAGQSSDDLDELDDVLAEPDGQVLWHSLEHLAELLRLLAVLDAEAPRKGDDSAGRTSSVPITP